MAWRDDRGTTPLLDCGDQLRAQKNRRRLLDRRIALGGAGIALVALTIVIPPAPRLVWNASASAPVGLYSVTPHAPVARGDLVVARVPDPWRMMAARRGYLPANVPLVKRVAAAAGDEVCALGAQVFINGTWRADRLAVDAKGRSMPRWDGCVRLSGRQFFLMMSHSPASFDGRYFGMTDGTLVVGKARLLWSR